MIQIRNIHKSFGSLEVLKGVDVTLGKGKVLVIIGPSGSGKTTFLRCLNLLEIPDQGEIQAGDIALNFAKGTKLRQENILALRKRTGMVFQSYNLFPHMTAAQNVMEGQVTVQKKSKDEARKRALELLKKWGWLIKPNPIRISYQEDSSNVSVLPGQWRSNLRYYCSTSRPPRLTPSW